MDAVRIRHRIPRLSKKQPFIKEETGSNTLLRKTFAKKNHLLRAGETHGQQVS